MIGKYSFKGKKGKAGKIADTTRQIETNDKTATKINQT